MRQTSVRTHHGLQHVANALNMLLIDSNLTAHSLARKPFRISCHALIITVWRSQLILLKTLLVLRELLSGVDARVALYSYSYSCSYKF